VEFVISHHVDQAGDMGEMGAIAMVVLVQGLDAEKAGRHLGSGGGALALPGNSGCVVRTGVNGMFMEMEGADEHLVLGN
jgi:hypothetical protein